MRAHSNKKGNFDQSSVSAEPEKGGFHTKMDTSDRSTEQGKSQSPAVLWTFQQHRGPGCDALRSQTHAMVLSPHWCALHWERPFPIAANDAAFLVRTFGGL